MKKQFFIFLLLVTCCRISFAQNVGIGTATPQFKLDVKNGSINTDSVYRIDGKTVLAVKGNTNTFVGVNSGDSVTTGTYNTGIGWYSLNRNTTGVGNSALGEALEFNKTGSYNTGIGHGALYNNTTAGTNTAVGTFALYSNTTGQSNTAIGMEALKSNTAGAANTAIGVHALYSVNSGYNTAVGYDALFNNTSYYNTGIGYNSLFRNTSGNSNTAVGQNSLWGNTTGVLNTAIGSSANTTNTTGSFNTAFGANSLGYNTTGRYNVANGYLALGGNINGEGNVGIGYWTLSQNGSANYNTAVGNEAGRGHVHGWNNTFIGALSNGAGTGFFNCIAIGANAVTTASNQVRIGNSSNNSIGGYANWTNISDGRYKKNIKEDVAGLDFIMQLRPVTYQLDITGLRKKLKEPNEHLKESKMELAIAEKESMIQTGFVAQEVEAAAKKLGYDFSGVDKPKNENDFYGLRYAEFVVPLVKAVQEQQQHIKDQQQQIDELKKKITELSRK